MSTDHEMPTEILRRAAALMRERFEREDVDDVEEAEFCLAVADWLDFIAPHARFGDDDALVVKHALSVARAYLGERARVE